MLIILSIELQAKALLKLERIFLDLGTAVQGEILTNSSLTVLNTGDEQMQFSLHSTCDCLTVGPLKGVLPPGKAVQIRIRLNTKEYKGPVKKHFYLLTSDMDHQTVRLTVKARVSIKSGTGIDNRETFKSRGDYSRKIPFYFFYTPDCHVCDAIKKDLFPKLEKEYKVSLEPVSLNILMTNNFNTLLKLKKIFKQDDDRFPVIMFHDRFISGKNAIYEKFPEILKNNLRKEIKLPDIKKLNVKSSMVSLSLIPVLVAGLLDGINPCAFATIIFLLSYLSYLQKTRKIIFITGIAYTFAVFSTYFLIGLGFFKGITSFTIFMRISSYINLLIALFAIYLALLSLRDYFLARKGRYKEMKLQLSDSAKKRIHMSIRKRSKGRFIILSAFLLGFSVSLFELACTGQIYLPAIIYMTKVGSITGYLYLTAYNLMFVIPLVIIFILYFIGISSEVLSGVFQKNIALIKLLTFFLFIGLAVLLLLYRVIF